jgi:hypothetical protein
MAFPPFLLIMAARTHFIQAKGLLIIFLKDT